MKVRFRKQWILQKFFSSSHVQKIFKKFFGRTVQMASLRKQAHVASDLLFFQVEIWAENTNP